MPKSSAPHRRSSWAVSTAVLAVALSAAACSGQSGTRPYTGRTPGAGGGGSSITATPPAASVPGSDTGTGSNGSPRETGDWTVLVRQARFVGGQGKAETTPPASMGKRRGTTPLLVVIVQLRQSSGGELKVSRSDWTLEDAQGGTYDPLNTKMMGTDGTKVAKPGRPVVMHLEFSVPDANGSYVLRFEPSKGGAGVLRVPVP